MTPEQLEQAIADARDRMNQHFAWGEHSEARKWEREMRDLISERTPERVKQMEVAMGLSR